MKASVYWVDLAGMARRLEDWRMALRELLLADGGLAGVIRATVCCLREGGVIVAPTETVYGLVTLWSNAGGRERIYLLKDRPADKRLQMLTHDLDLAEQAGVVPDARVRALARAFWPGPLTVVCPNANGGSVGVRIPDHVFILALLAELGAPVAATSANRSGCPPASSARDAVDGLQGEPDLVLDGGATAGSASTVVSLLKPDVELLRAGPISIEQIQSVLTS